jgi:hypothetical protein
MRRGRRLQPETRVDRGVGLPDHGVLPNDATSAPSRVKTEPWGRRQPPSGRAAVAESHRHSILELTIGWLLLQTQEASVIVGASSAEQMCPTSPPHHRTTLWDRVGSWAGSFASSR